LNGKVQKHVNFQKELQSNKQRIEEVLLSGRSIVSSDDRIELRVEEILELWNLLEEAALKKESRLNEASQQQQFNRTVEDIELWLSEVEACLSSEDYGKDLTSVQNLQKKHLLLESDVAGHSERIDNVKVTAGEFITKGHFDKENIEKKYLNVYERYLNLNGPIEIRKSKLNESLSVQGLFRDIEDEEAWIREKEPIVGSNNRGRDLIGVQNLIKKHMGVVSDIINHEPRVQAVCESGENLKNGFQGNEVDSRINKLQEHWGIVKEKAEKRKRDLDDALLVIFF